MQNRPFAPTGNPCGENHELVIMLCMYVFLFHILLYDPDAILLRNFVLVPFDSLVL